MRNRLLAIVLPVLLTTAAGAQDHSGHSGMAHGSASSATSTAYMKAMESMQSEMSGMTMTGKPGVDFAEMMIPHHQSAIDMAKAYLASGEMDPAISRIANDVVSSQQREIDELKAWLEANRSK